MNLAIVSGRLTSDPVLRLTNSGKAVVSFSIASNDYRGGNKTTEYHDCEAWEGLANLIADKCRKGTGVEVSGRLQTKPYTNKQGAEVKGTRIVVANFGFVGGRGDQDEGVRTTPDQTVKIDIDDIPF